MEHRNTGIPISVNVIGSTWPYACGISGLHTQFKTDGSEQETTNGQSYLNIIQPTEAQSEREANQQWIGKYGLYDKLTMDEALRTSSTDLETFFTENGSSNIGRLKNAVNAFQAARSGEGTTETVQLQSIAPQNSVERTLKDVLSILYANAIDLTAMDAESESRLREIAQLCPIDYGFGVYTARATLIKLDTLPKHYTSECERVPSSEKISKKSAAENESVFSVYPNPNFGTCTLSYHLNEFEVGTIKVFDLVGKEVLARSLTNNSGATEITLTNLNSGIYILKVEVDGENRFSERISILK